MIERQVIEQIRARPTSDGAGVKLLRIFGGERPERFDPFLLLDEFGSEQASDYLAGFPSHPHRGFETVTYMLQGKMEHRDHMDNVGLLSDGGVQWMTAGKGVIHSEMPKQTEGKMRGFQLWVNLPAVNKLTPAKYSDVASEDIPIFEFDKLKVKGIAGNSVVNGQAIAGYFSIPNTQVVYLDIHVAAKTEASVVLNNGLNTLAYVYDGEAQLGTSKVTTPHQTLVRLSDEGELRIKNDTSEELRMLLLAGMPLGEPIAQYGPFVMNSSEEIDQAIQDYQSGVLTA